MGHKIFEERELILEIFPGTSPELLPPGEVLYYRDAEGRVHIQEDPLHLVLEPLEQKNSTAPVICEACLRHLSRRQAQFFRFGVRQTSSGGLGAQTENPRHFRYVSLCSDTESCAGAARPDRLREILLRGILP